MKCEHIDIEKRQNLVSGYTTDFRQYQQKKYTQEPKTLSSK